MLENKAVFPPSLVLPALNHHRHLKVETNFKLPSVPRDWIFKPVRKKL
jgi:hypothetical protein